MIIFVVYARLTWLSAFTPAIRRATNQLGLAGLQTGRKSGYVWHDLRHEYGSYLVDQGATIQEVKELMRHADIRTTQHYLKDKDEWLQELAGRMAARHAAASA